MCLHLQCPSIHLARNSPLNFRQIDIAFNFNCAVQTLSRAQRIGNRALSKKPQQPETTNNEFIQTLHSHRRNIWLRQLPTTKISHEHSSPIYSSLCISIKTTMQQTRGSAGIRRKATFGVTPRVHLPSRILPRHEPAKECCGE